ncbi:hypothetical protein ANPL_00400 [Anaplasma platys]|uniref:NADH:ubiquinone oxidoreductase n=1 Tax=Anaplasma platys TaxID=949 RepID=A0A858PX97_9RICK|nr:NADH-ubiquinone oxidoreductase subunit NDUFA12 family protein [Anaplasma platys]QJC27202.1 hypothetical protein ANPL_00400 [Anaplasma platys]
MGVRAFLLRKLGAFLKTRRASCLYRDYLGNAYYSKVVNGKERRWVVCGDKVDPSMIPASCHLWLHYTSDELLPSSKETHLPNCTGTERAYHPHKR